MMLVLVLSTAFTFSSCKDDDEDISSSSIVGTWQLNGDSSTSIKFKSDKTFVLDTWKGQAKGHWSLGKDILTFSVTSNNSACGAGWFCTKTITTMSKNSMTWIDLEDGYSRMWTRK